jgi:hypothetical protein
MEAKEMVSNHHELQLVAPMEILVLEILLFLIIVLKRIFAFCVVVQISLKRQL